MLIRLASWVGRTFAWWILLFAALGLAMPQVFRPLAPNIMGMLGIIMFGMGLTLTKHDYAAVLRRPGVVALGVGSQFLIMPLLAFLLVSLLPVSPEVAAGVILVGCCPGGTASNVMTYLARGDVALSVACTSMTTLLAPVLTPLLMWLLASQFLPVDASAMFLSIVKVIILPLAAGLLVRHFLPSAVQKAMPILPLVSVAGIVLIIAVILAVNQATVLTSGLTILAVVALHNGLGLALGYGVARFAGLPLPQRAALCLETGMQNSGLAAALANAHLSPLAAVPGALFSVWHNLSGAVAATWLARQAQDTAKTDRSTA